MWDEGEMRFRGGLSVAVWDIHNTIGCSVSSQFLR